MVATGARLVVAGCLVAAAANLAPGGLLSVLAYRGHPGGQQEADAVAAWLAIVWASSI